MKFLTPIVYCCVAGVVISFCGSLYTGYRIHQEESRPRIQVLPLPAMGGPAGGDKFRKDGALPTPAR
ncbi:hypothetical protein WDW37_11275 [Bdellovibrionota bacterium FG-1]